MPSSSTNHGLDLNYQSGESWDYNAEMQTIEEMLVVRDADSNRSNYTPYSDAMYIATDSNDIYLGDGSSWVHFGVINHHQIHVSDDGTIPSDADADDIVLTPSN